MSSQATIEQLNEAKDDFITQWGAMGSSWGINRTMAQVHALLLVSTEPLATDAIMEELKISRGNANTNLRDLVGWGLIRSVIRKGERKEYFEAEKDVWKVFCMVARERKRREIDPAREVLTRCYEKTRKLRGKEAEAFQTQMKELGDFVALAAEGMERVAQSEKSQVMNAAMTFLKWKGGLK